MSPNVFFLVALSFWDVSLFIKSFQTAHGLIRSVLLLPKKMHLHRSREPGSIYSANKNYSCRLDECHSVFTKRKKKEMHPHSSRQLKRASRHCFSASLCCIVTLSTARLSVMMRAPSIYLTNSALDTAGSGFSAVSSCFRCLARPSIYITCNTTCCKCPPPC